MNVNFCKFGGTVNIQTHPEDDITDEQIKDFWCKSGIDRNLIKIYKYRSKSSTKVIKGKTPFGNCRLSPKEGAKFFEIYLAKKQKLIDNLNGRVSPLASNQEKE